MEGDTNPWYRAEAMSRNTSVSLGDHFTTFIDERLTSDRYSSASDVVRAGLRLLEEHEHKLDRLGASLVEGETSGPTRPFDVESFIARKSGG